MKPKYNYNIFLENMDKKFNQTKILPSSDTTSRDKDEIDKLVSLINENYNNYHDFYYKASDLYKLCNKKSNNATREKEYIEVRENLEKYNSSKYSQLWNLYKCICLYTIFLLRQNTIYFE